MGCGAPVGPAPKQDCRGGKIWHREDAARLRGCESVTGDLHLGGALDEATDFEALGSVQGSLIIGPSYKLSNLSSLGSVVRITGDLRVEGNWRLQGLFLGSLTQVAGAVEIRDNSSMATCSLHKLRSFGALYIERNRKLERVDLSGLEANGPGGVVSGPALGDVLGPQRIRQRENATAETRAKGS